MSDLSSIAGELENIISVLETDVSFLLTYEYIRRNESLVYSIEKIQGTLEKIKTIPAKIDAYNFVTEVGI